MYTVDKLLIDGVGRSVMRNENPSKGREFKKEEGRRTFAARELQNGRASKLQFRADVLVLVLENLPPSASTFEGRKGGKARKGPRITHKRTRKDNSQMQLSICILGRSSTTRRGWNGLVNTER